MSEIINIFKYYVVNALFTVNWLQHVDISIWCDFKIVLDKLLFENTPVRSWIFRTAKVYKPCKLYNLYVLK